MKPMPPMSAARLYTSTAPSHTRRHACSSLQSRRTFSTPGTYEGELTVTDESGMKAVRDFSVVIS